MYTRVVDDSSFVECLFGYVHHLVQITSLYGGALEFLFVVESTEDPAYRAVSVLIADFKV